MIPVAVGVTRFRPKGPRHPVGASATDLKVARRAGPPVDGPGRGED